jgi:hypothetical protein
VDSIHEGLRGPSANSLLERVGYEFGDACFQRIAFIFVATGNGGAPVLKAVRISCAWTPCIKEIWTESRGSIKSTFDLSKGECLRSGFSTAVAVADCGNRVLATAARIWQRD